MLDFDQSSVLICKVQSPGIHDYLIWLGKRIYEKKLCVDKLYGARCSVLQLVLATHLG
jgi:hypothetical protein